MTSNQNGRMSIEDTLAAVLDQLQQLNQAVADGMLHSGGGVSSVTIEDMSRTRPKITTKRYSGSQPEIVEAIGDHAVAVNLAEQAWKDDWKVSVQVARDALLDAYRMEPAQP